MTVRDSHERLTRGRARGRLLPVVALSIFLPASSQSILIPALPELSRQLEARPEDVAWVLTAYLVTASVGAPVAGRLGELFGRRTVMLVILAAFVGGSVMCAAADGLAALVAGRLLQGCVGGTFTTGFGLARDYAPRDRARASVALLSVVVGVGTGAGFVLGGLAVDLEAVDAVFWGGAALGLLALGLVGWVVPADPSAQRGSVDVRGGVLLVTGMAAPLVAVSQAGRWGVIDPRTLGTVALGAMLLAVWVAVERRHPLPLVDVAALAARPVLLANAATVLLGCGMFGLFVLTPQLAQQAGGTGTGFGLSATLAGLSLLPGALVMLVVGPASSRLGHRIGDHAILAAGGAMSALGLALLAVAHGSIAVVVAFSVLTAAGLGFALPAMPALVAASAPVGRVGEAVGFNAMMRGAGSSLGAQLSAAVLAASAVAGSSLPTSQGYAGAYGLAAALSAVAGALALLAGRGRSAPGLARPARLDRAIEVN